MGIAAFIGTAVGKVVVISVGLVVTAGVAGLSLYAMDFGVEATVIDKNCAAESVTVREKFTRATHTQAIGTVECAVVQEGNFVLFNIRSERIRVWETDARANLLWDSTWLEGGASAAPAFPFAAPSATRP